MARSKAKTPKKNPQGHKTTPKNKTPARLNLPTIKFQNKQPDNDLKNVNLGKLDVGFACIPGTKPNDGMELFRAQLPGEDTPILIQSLYQVSFVRDIVSSPHLEYSVIFDEATLSLCLNVTLYPDPPETQSMKNLRVFYRVITTLGLLGDEQDKAVTAKELKQKIDINGLYEGVRSHVNESIIEKRKVQHSSLKPELRPYQIRAVQWMLHQENNPVFGSGIDHPLYYALVVPDNETIYYNSVNGHITDKIPVVQSDVTCGLLADEMGLGKTVEVLACILCNPRNLKGSGMDDSTEVVVENQHKNSNSIVQIEKLKRKFQAEKYSDDDDYVPETNIKKGGRRKKVKEYPDESSDSEDTVPQRNVRGRRKKVKEYPDESSDSDIAIKRNVRKRPPVPALPVVVSSSDDEIPLSKITTELAQNVSYSELDFLVKDESKVVKSLETVELKNKTSDIIPESDPFFKLEWPNQEVTGTKVKNAKQKKKSCGKPTKSANKVAANLWYEQKLAEVNVNLLGLRPTEKLNVHCLCGSFDVVGDEVICIDCDKKQHRLCVSYKGLAQEFRCPQCWEKQPPIPANGTLIVVPVSLSKQWISEIKKHVIKNGIKVLVYKGVRTTGYLYPTNMVYYDIVLTTYQVLKTEIRYVGNEIERHSRFERKYHVPTSPLLSLQWWRICLDEAQIVGGATTEVANMAQKLDSVHRWAISGTPAQRGLSDLFGLIMFLGVKPYNDLSVWQEALFNPYYKNNKYPMHKFLSNIMWRSCKAQVLDQVNLVKQTEIMHWLKFSAVEEYFYEREHELCYEGFLSRLTNIDSLDTTLNDLDRKTLGWLLQPLLAIRQVCSHVKAVRGKYLTARNNIMSMDDLLEALITKNETECADAFRAKIAALNGLAAISIINGKWDEAGEHYRNVLSMIEQHKNDVPVDTLPHLHTLYNLEEVLSSKYSKLPPTLRDDQLLVEAIALEKKYIQKYVSGLESAITDYKQSVETIEKLKSKFESEICTWFPEFIDWIVTKNLSDDLFSRIESTLNDYNNTAESKFNAFANLMQKLTSEKALTFEITKWWDNVSSKIKVLRKRFKELYKLLNVDENVSIFPQESVHDAVLCHLRPLDLKGAKKAKCFMCLVEKDMLDYECLIFVMKTKKAETKRKKLSKEEKMEGTWKASQHEIVLKCVSTFSRNKSADEIIINEGDMHLKICEGLRKEFQEMRRLWTYYGDLIAAQDELSMCKERLRLRLGNEPVPKPKSKKNALLKNLENTFESDIQHINIIDIVNVPVHQENLSYDLQRADNSFSAKLGSLKYLKTLRKKQYSGSQPDPCPICKNQLEDNWSVLICGHCYCLDCMHNLLYKCSKGTDISCSVCRQEQPIVDISYVQLRKANQLADDKGEIQVEGSFSTKVEEIVRCLLGLLKEDNDVKVLIFSNWDKVLSVIAEALSVNKITFLKLTSANPVIIDKFKDPERRSTALLLPFNVGSKGLNLIEATHVFLVEPLMNPGEELQAISRVHRIGQTKPTFVHRFLIKDTIEESMFNAVASDVNAWQNDNVTVARVFDLFCKSRTSTRNKVRERSESPDMQDHFEEEVPENSDDDDGSSDEPLDEAVGSDSSYVVPEGLLVPYRKRRRRNFDLLEDEMDDSSEEDGSGSSYEVPEGMLVPYRKRGHFDDDSDEEDNSDEDDY